MTLSVRVRLDVQSSTTSEAELVRLPRLRKTSFPRLNSFETNKKPAKVLITNAFTTETMIDFDIRIVDEDNSIQADYVSSAFAALSIYDSFLNKYQKFLYSP